MGIMETADTIDAADDGRWHGVLARDAALDGCFVYAVRTTGVFCRPSCTSRRPLRRNVSFFGVPEAAEQAGYRACKRCRPGEAMATDPRMEVVRKVCRLIHEAEFSIPTLGQLGAEVGLSPSHLQRVFRGVMGISPRGYGEALRLECLKASFKDGDSVTKALYDAGFGSSSRLYEAAPKRLGMTPATYAGGGRGAHILFTVAKSSFGSVLVAATEKGIVAVSIGDGEDELVAALKADFPKAQIERDDDAFLDRVGSVMARLEGSEPHESLPFDIRATAFQWQVWERLLAIPRGETRTYGEIAAEMGRPGAARAVGRACGSNRLAVIIPCHRAVGRKGALTGYRWGTARKRKLLAREQK